VERQNVKKAIMKRSDRHFISEVRAFLRLRSIVHGNLDSSSGILML
jgi:hypothetical protein